MAVGTLNIEGFSVTICEMLRQGSATWDNGNSVQFVYFDIDEDGRPVWDTLMHADTPPVVMLAVCYEAASKRMKKETPQAASHGWELSESHYDYGEGIETHFARMASIFSPDMPVSVHQQDMRAFLTQLIATDAASHGLALADILNLLIDLMQLSGFESYRVEAMGVEVDED